MSSRRSCYPLPYPLLVALAFPLLAAVGCGSPASEAPEVEAPPAPTPLPVAETAAPSFSTQSLIDEAAAGIVAENGFDPSRTRILTAVVDLDDDGAEDGLALFVGPDFCGTGGCTMMVFHAEDGGLERISEISLVRDPVILSEESTNGWRDLVVQLSGGGGPSGRVALRFDGNGYPENPSMEELLPASVEVRGEVALSLDD